MKTKLCALIASCTVAILGVLILYSPIVSYSQPLTAPILLSHYPPANNHQMLLTAVITATFDQPLNPSTVNSQTVVIQSLTRGVLAGEYETIESTVYFTPAEAFLAGEWIQVSITTATQNLVGEGLAHPAVWQFQTVVATSNATFSNLAEGQELINSSRYVNLGDFDQDGDLDAFATGQFEAEQNLFWLNNGLGVFTSAENPLGVSYYWSAKTGDFDQDGDLDIVTGDYNFQGQSRIWTNDGQGVFTPTQTFEVDYVRDIAVGDIDGDSDLDLVFTSSDYPGELWLNNGSGQFSNSEQAIGTSSQKGIRLADLDGDYDLDIFVVGSVNKVLLNHGGVFTPTTQNIGQGVEVALEDIDSDGDFDALTCGHSHPTTLWLNQGTGLFTESEQELDPNIDSCLLADLDGDGDLDGFLSDWEEPGRMILNDGAGQFTIGTQSLPTQTLSVAVGDIDGDGDNDLFLGQNTADQVWINDGYTPFEAITGLIIETNSPTELGAISNFTATVATGSDVTYNWQFGDGMTNTGALVGHIYPAEGSYTVTVTAHNWASSQTTTAIIEVTSSASAPYRRYLPLLLTPATAH